MITGEAPQAREVPDPDDAALITPAPGTPAAFAMPAPAPSRTLRPAVVPADLTALDGPRHGIIELPRTLCWSEDDPSFDLDDRDDVTLAYEYVLEAGSMADICRWLDAGLLAEVWPELSVGPARAAAWEHAHPSLRRRRLGAAA